MQRIKVAPAYTEQYLEIERPQPLTDKFIESLIIDVMSGKISTDISDQVYSDFKNEFDQHLHNSILNNYRGLEMFTRRDIINGCTQYIDNLYMSGNVQVMQNDYRYHQRLNLCVPITNLLHDNLPLIIALPFPKTGQVHERMSYILDEALEKNVSVHIDGAWITCSRDISFDFNHPAIKSVGISLSKGYGLGWNRIGVRYSRETIQDSVTIMNDFHMNNRALSMIGLHFLKHIPPDYLWTTYGDTYFKICNDFNLVATNSIHLALKNNEPVGLSPLIRHLHE